MQYINYAKEDMSLSNIQELFGDCMDTHSGECKCKRLKCIAKCEKLYYSDNQYKVYGIQIICPKCGGQSYYDVERFGIKANELIGWKED